MFPQYLQHSDCLSPRILSPLGALTRGKINLSRFCRKIPNHHFHCAQFSPSRPVCLRQGVDVLTSDVDVDVARV